MNATENPTKPRIVLTLALMGAGYRTFEKTKIYEVTEETLIEDLVAETREFLQNLEVKVDRWSAEAGR